MKTKLALFVTVLAAALFEVGCASLNSDPTAKIQGTWEGIMVKGPNKWYIEVVKDELKFGLLGSDDYWYKGKFTANETETPHQCDLTLVGVGSSARSELDFVEGPLEGKVVPCIYKFEDKDTILFVTTVPGGDRPKDFTREEGYVYRLKRK